MKIKTNFFIRAGIWSVLGIVFVRGINLISTPIFTRLLSTAEYGQYNIFVTYSSILMYIVSLGLTGAVSRGIIEFKEKKSEYLSSLIFLSFIPLAVCFAASFILDNKLRDYLGLTSVLLGVPLLVLYSFASFVIAFLNAMLMIDYHYVLNGIISGACAVLNVGISVILMLTIYEKNKYLGRILGSTIITILFAFGICIFILLKGKKLINISYWKYGLSLSIPLIPHNLANLLLGQSDRLMINSICGSSSAGIYSLIHSVGWLLATVIEAFNNVWIPYLFRSLESLKFGDIKTKCRKLIIMFSVVTFSMIAVSPEIVKIMGAKEYWDGIKIVIPIIISVYIMFLYTLYVNVEFYYKKTGYISLGTVIATVLNILINLCLLPSHGYYAAAYSTFISYLVLLFVHMFIVHKKIKLKPFRNIDIWGSLMVCIIYGLSVQLFLEHIVIRYMIGTILIILYIVIVYFMSKLEKGKEK